MNLRRKELGTRGIKNTERLKIGIGEVVINFQLLEYELSNILCRRLEMKNDDDSHRISAAMSFKQKVNLYCDVYIAHTRENTFELDIPAIRKALSAAEEFRNSVVHSFWHVKVNKNIVWMSTKSNLSSKNGLKIVDGVANIRKLEKGIECIKEIRNWYLGETEKLEEARKQIQKCTNELSRKV